MITLYRAPSGEFGTFGILFDGDKPLCNTLEDKWINNKSNISCIPEGRYKVVKHNTKKYPNVWRLQNVKGRTSILIHAGNTADDTTGCILVGRGFGVVTAKPGVINSRSALDGLRGYLPKEFLLEIKSSNKPAKSCWFKTLLKGN